MTPFGIEKRLSCRFMLQASLLTISLVGATEVQAQCSPDPTLQNTTTTCTGTDADGLTVSTSNTIVVVEDGAVVQGSTAPAIDINLPADLGGFSLIDISGTVDGVAHAGIKGLAPVTDQFSQTNLTVLVREGAVLTGSYGLLLEAPGSGNGSINGALNNAGTIVGRSGIAITAISAEGVRFTSIVNRPTGIIGAIRTPSASLTNNGLIDGGSLSAIALMPSSQPMSSVSVLNPGTITSTSVTPTIDGGGEIINSGVVVNAGTGSAVSGRSLNVTNQTSGTISSAGADAIIATDSILLENNGTITGNVIVSPGDPDFGSTIRSVGGTIQGDVILGAGNDVIFANYTTTGLFTGATGLVDGGSGEDLVVVAFGADTTVSTPIAVPNNFERVSLAPEMDVTTTLAEGFLASIPLSIEGLGTIRNETTISGPGRLVVPRFAGFLASNNVSFINAGTLRSTGGPSDGYALPLNFGVRRFENQGVIESTTGGVDFSTSGTFLNLGEIMVASTGVITSSSSFENSGTILSTGGSGLILTGSAGNSAINSGTITGAVAGVELRTTLENSGTISSNGTGVLVQSGANLFNLASGVINGEAFAIKTGFPASRMRIVNAGTINGNVVVDGFGRNAFLNGNRYYALPGGILNGDLTLGSNATLIAELVNDGTGPFAGINGNVFTNDSSLRFRVRNDAEFSLALPAGFADIGFDLFDGATLNLDGSIGKPVLLAGTGTVDLDADIAVAGIAALAETAAFPNPGEPQMANDLAITSRGDITVTREDGELFIDAAISLFGETDFTNLGTITVRDRATTVFSPTVAINGGDVVSNVGSIVLEGADGLRLPKTLINSGSIVQAAGSRPSIGVRDAGSIENSGTIQVGGSAIEIGANTDRILNSGLVSSTGGVAIVLAENSGFSSDLTIVNEADGTISGADGQFAIRLPVGFLDNAGSIVGSVDLGFTQFGRSFASSEYISRGGTIAGDLLFGSGSDSFVALNGEDGVSGTIDGGDGNDLYVVALDSDGTVTLGFGEAINFETLGARVIGADTQLTLNGDGPTTGDLFLSGDGQIINNATIDGIVRTGPFTFRFNDLNADERLARFDNRATIGGFIGQVGSFDNSGVIAAAAPVIDAVSIESDAQFSFDNAGTISGVVTLFSRGELDFENSGEIDGAVAVTAFSSESSTAALSVLNVGSITGAVGISARANNFNGKIDASVVNSGIVEATAPLGHGIFLSHFETPVSGPASALSITNSGTIRANSGGTAFTGDPLGGISFARPSNATLGIGIASNSVGFVTVNNDEGGLIEATGTSSAAIAAFSVGLDLSNSGTIRGTNGTALQFGDGNSNFFGLFLAGAIHTVGGRDDRIVNTGTVVGSIDLGLGNDRIVNRGAIRGDVFLGEGDDTFVQLASAIMDGTVDAGAGTDKITVDSTEGGTVNADSFVNFERFGQIGTGSVTYNGTFQFNTINLADGTVNVAVGQRLETTGRTAITGGDGDETVISAGIVGGSISLGGGNDSVINAGVIEGSVFLGSGDDRFVEGANSRVDGMIDSGAGTDLFTAELTGNKTGIGARTGFERLSVEGNGTLNLVLDQDFESIALSGTGLNLVSGAFYVDSISGSDQAESLAIDFDVAQVMLGGGNDTLSTAGDLLSGRYDGSMGSDRLLLASTGPVTIAGAIEGFEQIELQGGHLIVAGRLGSAGHSISFGDVSERLTLGSGGTLAGTVNLAGGDDTFTLATGGTLAGSISGGTGADTATIGLDGGSFSLDSAKLSGFETLYTEGNGTLLLVGEHQYNLLAPSDNLTIATIGTLEAGLVQFGAGNNLFEIAGRFTGSADGGAGTDALIAAAGTEEAPVAFADIINFETLAMTGGFGTLSGTATLAAIDILGGRFVGFAGSNIVAPQIQVGPDASFGTAGRVDGSITVDGILSPGVSIGSITVNGNVAMRDGSTALFEIGADSADSLIVDGAVSIGSDTTLQLVSSGMVLPGKTYDLIVASQGITGSFDNITREAELFGIVLQEDNRIRLLAEFLREDGFRPQVNASIDFINTTIRSQSQNAALIAALPSLLGEGGRSDPLAFAQLTPEPYATATQQGVGSALLFTDLARSPAFEASSTDPKAFAFADIFGEKSGLEGDRSIGSADADARNYGLLSGLGFGTSAASVGAFVGYFDSNQQIDSLGAETNGSGYVAGVEARYRTISGLGAKASIIYSNIDATTDRSLPIGSVASGAFDISTLSGDLSLSYETALSADWLLRPIIGVTYLKVTRGAIGEAGGGPFALSVSKDRHTAGFVDAELSIARSGDESSGLRPFASVGVRYQFEGRIASALGGYAGGGLGLTAFAPTRDDITGSITLGAMLDITPTLEIFGSANGQIGDSYSAGTASIGLKLMF